MENNIKFNIDNINIQSSTLYVQEPIAYFKINNIQVSIYDKKSIPNKFIRFMQKKILGIDWIIEKE